MAPGLCKKHFFMYSPYRAPLEKSKIQVKLGGRIQSVTRVHEGVIEGTL